MNDLDFIKDLGELAIGSRLKRLSDLLFSQVMQIYIDRGVTFEPKWLPTFMAIHHLGAQSILEIAARLGVSHPAINQVAKELIDAKLVSEHKDKNDRRRRILELTQLGKNQAAELEVIWKDIRASITNLLHRTDVDLIDVINRVEDAARQSPLYEKARSIVKERENAEVEIIPFEEKYASDFESLNKEWITRYFHLEESDHEMLPHAKKEIIDPGGHIVFARDRTTGKILGTCAMKKHTDGSYELTKMAVTETAQGRGIGKLLAKGMIAYSRQKGLQEMYLETNSKLVTAIHLYRKLGFKVVPIPDPSYSRADVKMVLAL